MCLHGSRPLRWVSAPARWWERRHFCRGTSVGGGISTAKAALRIMPLTWRGAHRTNPVWVLKAMFRKEADLGTGRLDPVRELRIFLEGLRHHHHDSAWTFAFYTSAISLTISHYIPHNVPKNDSPRLETAGCPPNTALCATTSTSRHHTSSSHTRHPMVLGCCASKGGRGSREERGSTGSGQ
jgi:hypothetical protein